MVLRPDEEASLSQIERDRELRGNIGSGLKAAGSLALGAGAAGIGGKLMPFLNQYIPADLAVKGISKLSPKVGDFLKRGQAMGLNIEEGLQFVKDKLGGDQPAKQSLNIIEQESPELFQYLNEEIRKGRTPLQAAGLARLASSKFLNQIKKLEKNHKTNWTSIIQSVFGNEGMANPSQQPQQEQQQTGGSEKLMAILQKIQQSRGG